MAREVLSISVYRLKVNKDGYTKEGYYYGVGAPVFFWETPKGDWGTMRAKGMREAKRAIKEKFSSRYVVEWE